MSDSKNNKLRPVVSKRTLRKIAEHHVRRDLKKENLLVRACTDDKSECVHNIARKNCVMPEEVRFNLYMYLDTQLTYLYTRIL